jgi:hypothetical protein
MGASTSWCGGSGRRGGGSDTALGDGSDAAPGGNDALRLRLPPSLAFLVRLRSSEAKSVEYVVRARALSFRCATVCTAVF